MRPIAGDYAFLLFAAGLFNASLFAASILPLSTAYTVCEGLGFESGLDRTWKQAPVFYWLYTGLIVSGAAVVLIPNFPLVSMAILSQVLNGLLLPVVMYFMLKLINSQDLMGEHRNGVWFNSIAWATAGIVTALCKNRVMQGEAVSLCNRDGFNTEAAEVTRWSQSMRREHTFPFPLCDLCALCVRFNGTQARLARQLT